MPNLRSSPAADISREFQTGLPPDVRTRPYISVEYIKIENSDILPAGEDEIVDIIPPSDYLYKLINADLSAPSISGATSGQHNISVYGLGCVAVTSGKASYDKYLQFIFSHWYRADIESFPPDNQLLALQTAITDANNNIVLCYENLTDADQTGIRRYRLLIKKERV